ncbi:hypothetical protein EL22_00505 [Halostagnicola sp. A56]|uniref:hypothetical protein n=1 Tax=Halostagnicola sp. A56 TaxID=1495067 RepID=UPI00049F79AA|nr:hypothetical protein [Halostagnicola sp. A56]KDE59065.1 hypothetical protein EL22_00505 [Halostagnicola sp. A56]
MTGSIGTVSKLAVLSITVLVLVSSTGFSGAYFSDQASSDGGQISAADPKPTRGDLQFTPRSLSTSNQGTTTIHLEQPAGSTIDPETIVVTVDGQSVDAPVRTCNPKKCLLEPTAQAVADAGGAGEPTLEVTATLENGSELEASTPVRIFEPGGGTTGHGPSRDQGDSDEQGNSSDEQGGDSDAETVERAVPGPDEGESNPDSTERSSNDSNESVSERPGGENGIGDSITSANESGWPGADTEDDIVDEESGTEPTPNATSTDERTADRIETEETNSDESATNSSDRDETASDGESLGTSDTNHAGTDSDAGTDSATKVDDTEVDDTDDARLDTETTATSEAESDDRSSRRSDVS